VVHADIQSLKKEVSRKMQGALDVLHRDFAGLRTGRASVSLLEPIVVHAYGGDMPITQVATLGAPEPRVLTVQVWDKSLVKAVEKAIQESGLGLNPVVDGQLLRIPIPVLTEQRRIELSKIAARYAEETRVAIRNVRRHAMDDLKRAEKESALSQDQYHDQSKLIQELTDVFIKKVDEVLARKESEILQV
jgi:ribosome recycling factor